MQPGPTPVRLGLARDYRAEGWPSMDVCADQLQAHLQLAVPGLTPTDLAPTFQRLFTRLPVLGRRTVAFNADRLVNRHILLPWVLRRAAHGSDLFHVVDHSYAHVVHSLPVGRAGVYCHDLDAFRCLLEPERDPRPWWFRRLARRTLAGLQAAAVVFHSTLAVRRQLLHHAIVDPGRLVYAPYGVSAEFTPHPMGPVPLPGGLSLPDRFLLHVGSNAPRKRLDVLLDVFAGVLARVPGVRLVQVGGPWPAHLTSRIARPGVAPHVIQIRGLNREQLAELYRRAAAVLVTSDAEGFGLPVIEALACGAVVVASDIPVLRETGGAAALYCPVADIPTWVNLVTQVLTVPQTAPACDIRLSHASTYTWAEHARVIGQTYLHLAGGRGLLTPRCD